MDDKERKRRQEELGRIEAWILAHPHQVSFLAVGIAILVFEIAMFLKLAIDYISR
jgi:hypothetical protein